MSRSRPALTFGGLTAVAALTLGALTAPAAATGAGPATKQIALIPSGLAAGDQFGQAVAVSAGTVVVGAPYADSGAGSVYVFRRPRSGWGAPVTPVVLSNAAATTSSYFGGSVAISGRTIVVGAENQTIGTHSDQGAVYVYTEPRRGWHSTTKPTATLTAANGVTEDSLGSSVAIDGDTIVAGAGARVVDGHQEQGAAYAFTEAAHGWRTTSHGAMLTDSTGGAQELFGDAVAISGSTIVIGGFGQQGGGTADIFAEPAHGWKAMHQTRVLRGYDVNDYDEFGLSVAISGSSVAVGAPGHQVGPNTYQGSAYVFTEPSRGWGAAGAKAITSHAELTSKTGITEEHFGASVAVIAGFVAVGAPLQSVGTNLQQGVVYGFLEPLHGWKSSTESLATAAMDGSAQSDGGQAIALDPGTFVFAAPSVNSKAGEAYVIARPGPSLAKLAQSHASWKLGTASPVINPRRKPRGGTVLSFTVNEASTVTLSFGQRGHHRGTIAVPAPVGTTKVYIDGKLGHGHQLAVGKANVTVTATNPSGTSGTKSLTFAVHA